MGGGVEKMVAVGLVWGITNAAMRRGARIWDHKVKRQTQQSRHQRRHKVLRHLSQWVDLLLTWQYSVPFLVNLSASAAFFHVLSGSPISVAVPVTNATTFAATTAAAMALGEGTRIGATAAGTLLIVAGVWMCVS